MLSVLRHYLPIRKALLILSETVLLTACLSAWLSAHLWTPTEGVLRLLERAIPALSPPDAILRCEAHRVRRLLDVGRELCAEAARRAEGASGRRRRPRARVDLVEVLFDERRRRFRVLHHPDLRPDFRAGERDFRRSLRR